MKVLTALNEELFAQKKPGHVEEILYESSKDNRKIQGWIVHPPDFDPTKKYPLILEIHGGPFADYGDRFDFEKQVLGFAAVTSFSTPTRAAAPATAKNSPISFTTPIRATISPI